MSDRLWALKQGDDGRGAHDNPGRRPFHDSSDVIPTQRLSIDRGTAEAEYLLPHWFVPAPTTRRPRRWRRVVGLIMVVSFVALAAYGFCSTQAFLGLG